MFDVEDRELSPPLPEQQDSGPAPQERADQERADQKWADQKWAGHEWADHEWADHKWADHERVDQKWAGQERAQSQYTESQYTESQYDRSEYEALLAAPGAGKAQPRYSWDQVPIEFLGHVLWTVDQEGLTDEESVELLAAHQRLINHQMALRTKMIVDVTDRSEGDTEEATWGEFSGLEAGTALTLTRRAAEMEVELAYAVVRRLPAVWSALYDGRIDWARARTIVRGVEHILDEDGARAVVAGVIDDAPRLTTGQLAARLRRACLDDDPLDAIRRYEESVERRRVFTMPCNDGTGDLIATNLPPDRLGQAFDHIDALARQLPDDRSIDQRRADVLLDLLSGRTHASKSERTALLITVDLETLVGLADRSADLAGWGPVVADIARRALEEGEDGNLRVRVTSADLAVDVSTRRPSAAQRRRVRHRYPTCVFPGCRMPAHRSDIDHTRRHVDHGPTHTSNLAPLCRFHHRAKDEGRWSYVQKPDQTITWTSPLGLTYTLDPRGP